MSRDRLLALFWPESDADRARHSLADSLYQIRKELGESAILSAGEDLRLDPGVLSSDVVEFEEALERGELQRAAEAYAGPLLDGFHLSDAPDFERWLDAERQRLARSYARALEQLAERATAGGDARGAVEWWRRLAAEEPYNARVTLRLMAALEAAGDRAGALLQARVHATLLEQELGAEPDPEVAAVAARLRSGPATTAPRGRDQDGLDVGAPVPAPASAGEEKPPPAALARVSGHVPQTRPDRGLSGSRAAGLAGVLLLGLGALLSLSWLLRETSARPGAAVEAAATSPKTIAVLPCANLSRDPEQEYFSDGLTEELTGVLSQVRALQVAARTSAFAFKGRDQDVREIGRTLNVGTVLECSVRREGDRVRVTAQLINTADGFHLWSETYEREGTDIFAIQSDLALRIAGALEAGLTSGERGRLGRRPTASPEAHGLYLKGRHFWNQRTPGGFVRAIEYFERAIEVDPRYAAAHAGLAMAYSLQGLSGSLAPQEARARMREAAHRAVQLDEESAEAHAALGAYLSNYEWDSDASERAYLRAIELDPSYGTARHLYANLLSSMGRSDEALTQRRKAVELDPLAPQLSLSLGAALRAGGRVEEGFALIRNALELDSTFAAAHASLGDFYAATGQLQEAVHAHQRAVALASGSSNARTGLARVLALAGRKDEARAMLSELQAEAERTGIYRPAEAAVFLALDDVEGALEWLERAYRQRHPGLRLVISHLRDTRLADDARFRDLRRRVGLPH